MRAPRMRVAVFGTSNAGRLLAVEMRTAGHTVEALSDLSELSNYQALIVAVGDARLAQAVDLLESYVHKGLIVFHTCLSRGVQVLDPLETKGCVVAAVAPYSAERWAVTTVDELGETVAELVLGEAQFTAASFSDIERPALAARVYYAQMLTLLAVDANADVFGDGADVTAAHGDALTALESSEVIAAFRSLEEPGMRRAYLEATRRMGEVYHREELEMWALQEETR